MMKLFAAVVKFLDADTPFELFFFGLCWLSILSIGILTVAYIICVVL